MEEGKAHDEGVLDVSSGALCSKVGKYRIVNATSMVICRRKEGIIGEGKKSRETEH